MMANYCTSSSSSSARTYEALTFSPPSSLPVEEKSKTPTITLTYFGTTCYVCFNRVKLGTSKVCHLTVKNPNGYKVDVSVKRFPFDKGFSLNEQQFSVDVEEEKTIDLTWIPTKEGSFREIMLLQANSGCQKQIILLGTAVSPPKKKQKSSLKREKVKVLATVKKDYPQLIATDENKTFAPCNSVTEDTSLHQKKAKQQTNVTIKGIFIEENCENENPLMCSSNDPVVKILAQKDAEYPLPATPSRRQTYVLNPNNTPVTSPKDSRQILKDITIGIQKTPALHTSTATPKISTSFQCRKMRLNRKANISSNRKLRNNLLQKVHKHSDTKSSLDIRRKTFVKLCHEDSFNDSIECKSDYLNDSLDNAFTTSLPLKESGDALFNVSVLPNSVGAHDETSNQMSRESFFLKQPSSSRKQTFNNFEIPLDLSKARDAPGQLDLKMQEIKMPDISHLSRGGKDDRTTDATSIHETIIDKISILQQYVNKIMTPQSSPLPADNALYHGNDKNTFLSPNCLPLIQHNVRICSSTQVKENKFEEDHKHHLGKELFPSDSYNTTINESDFSFLRGKSTGNNCQCSTGIYSKMLPPTITSGHFSQASSLTLDSSSLKDPKDPLPFSAVENEQSSQNNTVDQKYPVSTTFTVSPGTKQKKMSLEQKAGTVKHVIHKSKSALSRNERKSKCASRKTEQLSSEKTDHSLEKNIQSSNLSKQSRVIVKKQLKLAQSKLTLIKPIAAVSACVRHPNPFAARNIYYDEKWMIKQEFGFTRWLNFILTPPLYLSSDDNLKVDTGKFFLESMKDTGPNLAPTKEDMSFKTYTALRHMNKLRRASCMMFQSQSMATMIARLETEIENNKLCLRKDKALHADIGIKKFILNLLLCYNPLWLRIGLETVFGELIYAQSNNDVLSLSRFIVHRLLNNPDLAAQYAHPKVPHLYKSGYEEDLKKFTLKKFLLLVFFLDKAKLAHLIDHDPCLFCKNAKYKSSRDLLLIFSREFLSGEGDITRHLHYLGYAVSHQQTALEEFEYAVTNLAVDLRCGLRLARVIELILKQWNITRKLRVPAISRLQKIHNVEVCFEALKDSGCNLLGNINPRDIVDGHQEKTLSLLWQLIFKTQVEVILDKETLNEEIAYLQKNLKVQHDLAVLRGHCPSNQSDKSPNHTMNDKSIYPESELLQLLLKWCQCVCLYYDLKIENFTVSFCDGRALCYIIHHYHPSLLPLDAIKQETTLTFWQQDAVDNLDNSFELSSCTYQNNNLKNEMLEELLNNERSNLRIVFDKIHELGGIPITSQPNYLCNTIPDEKVVIILLAYLNCRLINLSQEIKAARVIQLAWRQRNLCRQVKQIKLENKAAFTIQRTVRHFLKRQRQIKLQKAVLLAQTLWRRHKARQLVTQLLEERKRLHEEKMAIIIQKTYRGYQGRKAADKRRRDIVLLQALARRWLAMKRYHRMHRAVACIGTYFRATCLSRQKRDEYLHIRNSVILLQSHIKRWLLQKKYKAVKASVVLLQAHVRMQLVRNNYLRIRRACITIQRWFRCSLEARKDRLKYLQLKEATIKLQFLYRTAAARRNFLRIKQASVLIQATIRQYLAQKKYLATKAVIVAFQKRWRATMLMKRERQSYLLHRNKIIFLQSIVRKVIVQRKWMRIRNSVAVLQRAFRKWYAQKNYCRMKTAAILIQRKWRAVKYGKREQMKYVTIHKAVVTIQCYFRSYSCKRRYLQKKKAAICIQAAIRMISARRQFKELKHAVCTVEGIRLAQILSRNERQKFLEMQKSAILIQAAYRGSIVRSEYRKKLKAVVKLQSVVRCWIMRTKYKRLKNAAICIQKFYRSLMLTRNKRQDYLKLRIAVIRVQSVHRGKKARNYFNRMKKAAVVIQSTFRCAIQRKRYKHICSAVLTIQRFYRAYQLGRQERISFIKLKLAAIAIQSAYRGMKCRKEVRTIKAVCVIQSYIRQYLKRKQYLKICSSCIKIQSFVRMYQQRNKYLLLRQATIVLQQSFRKKLEIHCCRQQFLTLRSASVKIQSSYRAVVQRKKYLIMRQSCIKIQSFWRKYSCRKSFREMKLAAIVLQRHYRAHLQFRKQRDHYLLLKKSVVILQSWVRMKLIHHQFHQQHQACILIQSYYRAYMCKKKYLQLRKSSLIIQRRYQALLQGQRVRNWYEMLKKSCIKIQAAVRGWLVRKKLSLYHQAATKIQAWYKQKMASVQYKRTYHSTLIIQQAIRAFLIGRQDRCRYIEMKKAVILIENAYCRYQNKQQKKIYASATKIQSYVRMFLAHKRYLRLKYSSIKLQAMYRMRRERIHYLKLRNATVVLQKYFQATIKRNQDFLQYHIMRGACITIQEWWRECLIQKKVQRNEAARTIQKNFKASRVRKQYLALKNASILVQRRWRKSQLQHQTKEQFKRQWRAAVTIQRFFRCYLIVKEIRRLSPRCALTASCSDTFLQSYYKYTNAAICIQAWYKMATCKRRYNKMLLIHELQKHAESCMQTKAAERLLHLQHHSASVIQCWYRGLHQRRHYMETKRKVILLQSFCRGYQQRRKYIKDRSSIIYLQRKWRAHLKTQEEDKLHEHREAAAFCMQKWYRGYKCRKEYQKSRLQVVMQASIRCVLIPGQSYNLKENLTNGLLTYRHHNCLLLKQFQCVEAKQHIRLHRFVSALFFHMRAICIQRRYRQYCSRKLAEQQIDAILTIQCWIRAKLVRARYLKLHSNIVTIQRAARHYLFVRHQAAIKIQAAVRSWLVRRKQRMCHKAAIIIQAAWHGYKQRCIYSGKEMVNLRLRLKEATASATEEKKLGRRASSSLYQLLGRHSLTRLLSALTELDTVTKLSSACCKQMAAGRALDILIHIVESCNRSVPHMELIKYSVNIFLNLAKYTETVDAVWKTKGLLNTVLHLMKIYREKGMDIFTKLCTLLWIFSQDPKKAEVIKKNKAAVEQLKSFHYLVLRRQNMLKQQHKTKIKASIPLSFSHKPSSAYITSHMPIFPDIEPDWVLCRNIVREFENPATAITAIIDCLGLETQSSAKIQSKC